jgi:hypothetical protein
MAKGILDILPLIVFQQTQEKLFFQTISERIQLHQRIHSTNTATARVVTTTARALPNAPLFEIYTIKNEFFCWLTAHHPSSFQKYIMGRPKIHHTGFQYSSIVVLPKIHHGATKNTSHWFPIKFKIKMQCGQRQRVFGKIN